MQKNISKKDTDNLSETSVPKDSPQLDSEKAIQKIDRGLTKKEMLDSFLYRKDIHEENNDKVIEEVRLRNIEEAKLRDLMENSFGRRKSISKDEDSEILNIYSKDDTQALSMFKFKWSRSKNNFVQVFDIRELITDTNFIDFVVSNKILFSSNLNKEFTESISEMLFYLSEKLDEVKENHHDVGKINKNIANKFAKKIGNTLDELEEKGFKSLKQKADELNLRGVKTQKGKKWEKMTVSRAVKRWQEIKIEENKNLNKPESLKP